MPACPRCKQDNAETAKFCSNCGTPLVVRSKEHVRKTVTVLFSDVVGSTSLGERLDPESMRRVVAHYFDAMRDAIESHGGTVQKFIGDAVMAVFGIPVLHEDDALRAIRAAFDMLAAVERLNDEVGRSWNVVIELRTGINTGEVVAGEVAGGHELVTGDAVNVAARFEGAARPGAVLIGASTRHLVDGVVKTEALEPLKLKGKSEPVPAFRVISLEPDSEGWRPPSEMSAMVGRERELALLGWSVERAARERSCHLVTVLGPAGAGKSRLAAEAVARLPHDIAVFRGRCPPYGEGITFSPIVQVVKQAAGITDDDSQEQMLSRVRDLLSGEKDASAVAELVGGVLGAYEGFSVVEETFRAVRRLFETLASSRTLVVLFDDIHWGQQAFLELLEHIAEWSVDAPIVLLCLARPELFESRAGWGGGKSNATSLSLEPLTSEESKTLLRDLSGAGKLSASLREQITVAAGGNPLFIEHIAAMLQEVRDGGKSALASTAGELSGMSIPPTITALLGARIDRLPDHERRVTERSSVVGDVFSKGAALELSPDDARTVLDETLWTLVRKALLQHSREPWLEDEAFRFSHILIRDVAYNALSKELRADLHERCAKWLERAAGNSIAEYEETIGHHLECAFRYRQELGPVAGHERSIAARAAHWLVAAGRRASNASDLAKTSSLYERADALLEGDAPRRAELLPELCQCFMRVGDMDRARAAIEKALQAAEASGDPRLAARVSIQNYLFLEAVELPDPVRRRDAVATADAARGMFEEAKDNLALARSFRLIANVRWNERDYADAERALEEGLVHAQESGDEYEEARLLTWLGWALVWGPSPVDTALARCDQLLEGARPDSYLEANAKVQKALLEAMHGELERARELMTSAKQTLSDLGLRVSLMEATESGALVEMLAGDPAAAEAGAAAAHDIAVEMGDTQHVQDIASLRAQIAYAMKRYDEAERLSEIAERAAGNEATEKADWGPVRAKVLARRGRVEEAIALARESAAIASTKDDVLAEGHALLDLADIMRMAGRTSEATECLRRAAEVFDRKGIVPLQRRTNALIHARRARVPSDASTEGGRPQAT
jgi:class 3 adenylate cyclase/tetratricopeptide (TPR) repeat protein